MTDSVVLLNEVVGGFRLESLLGSGAMGVVYLASHQTLGRRVALKVLREEHASDRRSVSRFFREARVVNAIRHPNIVDIFDFLESREPERVAYVMEYISGPTLARLLRRGGLGIHRALNVMEQLADALAAVHAVGVVHRDLKPSNILLVAPADSDFSQRPSVKITDFGICKVTDASADGVETATGMILGTPSYMAPEQITAQTVTGKTDVYALGQILYEMLTGRRLFPREIGEAFRQKLARERPRIDLPRDLPGRDEVRELIEQCLSERPEDRPSARELAGRVASLRDGLSTIFERDALLDTMADPTSGPLPPPRRRIWRLALSVVSAGFLAGLAGALALFPRPSPPPAIVARSIEEIEKPAPPLAEPQAIPPVEETEELDDPEPTTARRTPKTRATRAFKRKELPQW